MAVLLAGNGVYDGSETTEAVAALVHLSRASHTVGCYAPDQPQAHAVNHTSGTEEDTPRNVMVESARIARGSVSPLAALDASEWDALVVPGGFGAAKNLCDFAFKETEMTLDPVVDATLKAFHSAGKPIALCCISPVLAAKAIPGVTVTVGQRDGDAWPYAGTVGAIEAFGAAHKDCDITEVCVDAQNKVVTAPAYMYDGKPHQIFDSVGNMVDELNRLL